MTDGQHDGSLADWLSRIGISWPGRHDTLWTSVRANRAECVHTTRALRRLLEIIQPLDQPILLDLGLVSGANVTYFGREVPGRILVNDLYTTLDSAWRAGAPNGLSDVLRSSIVQADESVDAVLCWDLCDYLEPGEGATLAESIARILKPGGVVLAMFSTVLYEAPEFTRFVVEDHDHLLYRPCASSMTQRRVWLSRDVVRMFAPLRADETYLLAHGEREVLLRKPKVRA